MKKFRGLFLAVSMVFFGSFASANETFTFLPSLGLSLHTGNMLIDGYDSARRTGFSFEQDFVLVHNFTGLALDLSTGVGYGTAQDFPVRKDLFTGMGGFYTSARVGLGYSFVRTEHQNLSLFCIFGLEGNSYSKIVSSSLASASFVYLSSITKLGGYARYTILTGTHFGFAFGCEFSWVILDSKMTEDLTLKTIYTETKQNNEYTLKSGAFCFKPCVGITWAF